MRGPLNILKESWEASTKSDESVLSCGLAVHEKLAKMSELVLGPNDSKNSSMIVMPSSFLAQWQGPYLYQVDMLSLYIYYIYNSLQNS